jgi:hypothetical protein
MLLLRIPTKFQLTNIFVQLPLSISDEHRSYLGGRVMCNTDSRLKETIATNADLSAKMDALIQQLTTELHAQFLTAEGFAVPSAMACEVFQQDSLLRYSHAPNNVAEFITGAELLVSGLVSEQYGDVQTAVTDIVTLVAGEIIGTDSLSIGVKGDSRRTHFDGKVFFSCTYGSTAKCDAAVWFQEADFYVVQTLILVKELES